MKVVLPRSDLVALAGKIQNVVPSKAVIPILSNVLIEAKEDQIELRASDLTISILVCAQAKVIEEGAVTLPARRFFQLIRELTTSQVELHATSPETISINAGSAHFKIQGMHQAEFPAFPDFAQGVRFSMSAAMLREMITRTSFAAARDDSRQILNGLLLQKKGARAEFTGTDGKRLSFIHAQLEEVSSDDVSCIIPLKAIEEIARLLDAKEEVCTFTLMSDKIAVEVGDTILVSKLLSGQFPDTARVIPEKQEAPLVLHREELISLLRQVSLFTSDTNSVRFTFTNGALHLTAGSGEIGEGVVSMPVNYSGEKLEIAFNAHYFLDILRHSKDEIIHLSVKDAYNPGLITDSTNVRCVLMPMRL